MCRLEELDEQKSEVELRICDDKGYVFCCAVRMDEGLLVIARGHHGALLIFVLGFAISG